MYLRTPKRYSRGQKRSPVSLRWVWLWLLTPVVVIVGIQIYNHRDEIAPPIHQAINSLVNNAQNSLATAGAPTLSPTQDPAERLVSAKTDWTNGRIESSVSTYEQILDALPNDVEVHFRYSLGLAMEGRYQDALVAAERTITADPFTADGWALRSMMLDLNDRYGEAIASAQRALELNPKNARAMAFLAQAYDDSGQHDLALETVNKALDLDGKSFEALRVRGWLAWNNEYDTQAAKSYYQKAYDAAPNLPLLAIDLAQINLVLEKNDEAVGLVRGVVESNPQNSLALFWLGNYYYSKQGSFTQASDYLGRCVQSNPQNILCQALLGRVQISMNAYQQAAESLQKAIDLGSKNPRHYNWAARAYMGQGNCPAAVPLLQKGYTLAEGGTDTEVLTAIADNLRECQSSVPGGGLPEVTAEPTVEAEPTAAAKAK
jgi:tetratricopeptide (TPR) repeat protein